MVWNLQSEMRSAGLPAPLAGCAEPLEHHGNAQKTLDTDFTNILGFRLCAMEFGNGVLSPTAPMLPEKSFCPTPEV